jgi:hypothetical protein
MSRSLILGTNPTLPKENMILPTILLAQAHPHQLLLFRFLRFLIVKELLPLSPLPNTIS